MPSIDNDLQMKTFKQGPHPCCAQSQSSTFQGPEQAPQAPASIANQWPHQWSLPERESRLHTPSEHPGKWQGQWDISAAPSTGSLRPRPQLQSKWKSFSHVQLFVTLWIYSPWNSPGQNTRVDSHSFLQVIFQSRDRTQVSCDTGGFFTSWATREAQEILKWVAYAFSRGPSWLRNQGVLHCRWILYQLSYTREAVSEPLPRASPPCLEPRACWTQNQPHTDISQPADHPPNAQHPHAHTPARSLQHLPTALHRHPESWGPEKQCLESSEWPAQGIFLLECINSGLCFQAKQSWCWPLWKGAKGLESRQPNLWLVTSCCLLSYLWKDFVKQARNVIQKDVSSS